jgi:hypothetical protein
MRLATKIAAGVIAAGIIEALLIALLIPIDPNWISGSLLFYSILCVTALYSWLYTGAAFLFLASLKVYKVKLRYAYVIISSVMLLNALASAQMPVIAGLNLWQSWWIVSGAYGFGVVLSTILLYVGIRSLARLVGTKTILTKATFVLPAITILSIFSMLLSRISSSAPKPLVFVFLTFSALLYLTAGLTIITVKRQAGANYTRALNWLAAGCIAGFTMLLAIEVDTLLGPTPDIWSLVIQVIALIAGIMFLGAGYTFYQTKDLPSGASFSYNKTQKTSGIASALDLVTYAAGLASNQTSFDTALDTVRMITSALEVGQVPSAEDDKKLLGVYLQVEQYLTISDPIRTFTKDELRTKFSVELCKQLNSLEVKYKKGE